MRLQVSGVSADDANFLLAGKKIFRHHMSQYCRMREVGLKVLMWRGRPRPPTLGQESNFNRIVQLESSFVKFA
jgi:hypothetical protein